MDLKIIFKYLINFLLALFIILILYFYFTDRISSLWVWINIVCGVFLRTILIELINQKE